eukprot:c5470_g1_i1.p1 GENE.c5470_g1_i1~~c5470_g1_i1.p1  ORF type:complete len:151 (+),score=24.83 c5470_g1_i1:23-454(+)
MFVRVLGSFTNRSLCGVHQSRGCQTIVSSSSSITHSVQPNQLFRNVIYPKTMLFKPEFVVKNNYPTFPVPSFALPEPIVAPLSSPKSLLSDYTMAENNKNQFEFDLNDNTLLMSSTLKKRRTKMNKHKRRKMRRLLRHKKKAR